VETKTKFSWRAFTSLYITLSFIVMIISGIILYIAPPGRIAKWAYIPILGFEKDQWQALHTIFTFLFIIANGFHLYFNWKPFLSYLSDKRKQFFRIKRELLSAIFITAGIFYLVLLNAQPFKTVTEFGESIYELHIPINGLLKSESSLITPVAFSKLRCGARSKPFLIKSDLICTPKYKPESF